MSSLAIRIDNKPIKVNVKRMEEIFENTNPYKSTFTGIIKDYIYINQKRVIV